MTDLTVEVPAESASYALCLREDFGDLGAAVLKTGVKPDRIAVIADTNTAPLFAEEITGILGKTGVPVTVVTLPEGETNKNLTSICAVYDALIEAGATRKSLLVSLGGGVIGDMTGFASATYMRGMPFIQIPTTLLSQVDASIGGKTGFDYQAYKNMIGAFHMPSLVYISTGTLKTLSERQYRSGLSEVIKAGFIKDRGFTDWLVSNSPAIMKREASVCLPMIRKALTIKKEVVEADPYESGERMLLNFGHTIGHAIEKAKDFELTHGECVAVGMAAAAKISAGRGMISPEEAEEVLSVCRLFGLPLTADGLTADTVIKNTHADKKRRDGATRFILLKGIGEAVIARDVTDEEMAEALKDTLI